MLKNTSKMRSCTEADISGAWQDPDGELSAISWYGPKMPGKGVWSV